MLKCTTVLLLCVTVGVLSTDSTTKLPTFCHGLDCPRYSVLQSTPGYELRQYAGTQWVATRLINKTYTDDMRMQMFQSLFRYISGNNTSGVKINMTSPVLTTIRHTGNINHDTVVEMHFMIPFAMQPYPPRPTESHVYITFFPSVRAYVKSFPGFATGTDFLVKVIELEHEINNSTLYDAKHYHTASYDGPMTINRHNEVWLMATMQGHEGSPPIADFPVYLQPELVLVLGKDPTQSTNTLLNGLPKARMGWKEADGWYF